MINNRALELFWYWIRERESIRTKKEAGEPQPWTKDSILKYHHFCNVRREDDRVTKELRELAQGYLTYELPTFYTGARLLNHAPSVKILMKYGWEGLKEERGKGTKIFHTAYVVSTCGQRMDKIDYVKEVVDVVNESEDLGRLSLERAHSRLMEIPGLGSFLAGQVVADLKNDRYLVDAHDWWTWSCIGPGSQKGLNYIFGKGACTAKSYSSLMKQLNAMMPEDISKMRIHMQDLQNCLCEFSKYWGHKNGLEGRRRNYHGHSVRSE